MTINYPVAEVEVRPVPKRWISRPQEDREKEAAEKGVDIWKVSWTDGEIETITTSVSWVSHGNYAMSQPKPNAKEGEFFPWIYIGLESEHFDQIIEAFETGEIPKENNENFDACFTPFWSADVPLRGMMPMPSRLRAYYYCRKKEAFILQEQKYNMYTGAPANTMDSMGFMIEDFKKIRDAVRDSKEAKPVHYCRIGW